MDEPNPIYSDSKGRTTADRIAAVRRGGNPVTDQQREDARLLLESLLLAAVKHGVTLDDFDWTIDLPGGCLDIVLAKTRKA
ncbi:hypothetical protein [Streptomyces sp. YKOK-I1]